MKRAVLFVILGLAAGAGAIVLGANLGRTTSG